VLKNLVTLSAGEIVARAMHALAFVLLARALGKEALGQFGFAAAVTSYLLLIVTQGFDAVAIRTVSRSPGELRSFIENVIGLRLVLAGVVCGAILVDALVSGGHPTLNLLLLVLCLSYVGGAIAPRWGFLALERSRPIALAGVISQGFFLAGAVLVRAPSHVVWAAAAQGTGELAAALFLLRILSRSYGPLTPRLDRPFARRLVRDSWPVTLSLLLGNMMYNFDVVMLGAMGRGDEIGVYIACYRPISAFAPLLAALQASALPALARSYPDFSIERRRVRRLTWSTAGLMIAAALALALYAREILELLFGHEYGDGARILQVLACTLPLLGFRSLLRQVLVAFHLQHLDTTNIAAAAATNVLLDVALIPSLGALGCAISTVGSEIVFAALSAIAVRTRVDRMAPENAVHADLAAEAPRQLK